jgi:hypothetical protein
MDWKNKVEKEISKRVWLYADGVKDYPHYLNSLGTSSNLTKQGMVLREGLLINFYNDDATENHNPDPLLFEGVVHFDDAKKEWYAILDEKSFRHLSDER